MEAGGGGGGGLEKGRSHRHVRTGVGPVGRGHAHSFGPSASPPCRHRLSLALPGPPCCISPPPNFFCSAGAGHDGGPPSSGGDGEPCRWRGHGRGRHQARGCHLQLQSAGVFQDVYAAFQPPRARAHSLGAGTVCVLRAGVLYVFLWVEEGGASRERILFVRGGCRLWRRCGGRG